MSRFAAVTAAAPIEVFAVNRAFLDDDNPKKVNLSIGAYRTEEGRPWILPVVTKVVHQIAEDSGVNFEYLPPLGMENLANGALKMLLGEDNPAITNKTAFAIHALGGTGPLRLGAEFLVNACGYKTYYYSNPSWENHRLVFNMAGFKEERTYRYWNAQERTVDIEGMLEDLGNAPENSVIILHACAHNPTGSDPTQEQWKRIAEVVKARKLFPFFDSAYQGFASGDLERDSWAVRYFAEQKMELFCSQSFSKNFGLYNERVGNLAIVLNGTQMIPMIQSQMTIIVRSIYSNPPSHGAHIVSRVLSDKALYAEWQESVVTMSERIKEMRRLLREKLEELRTPGTWSHITDQIGMFSYTGLTPVQVAHLVDVHHIFLLKSGRINMCGLNRKNLDHVAHAINEAVTKFPESN